MKEQGIDFVMGQWRGLAAPKGTPPDVIKKLHDAFKKGMDDPVFRKNAKDMVVNLSYLGPEAFGKLMAHDMSFMANWSRRLKNNSERRVK